MKRVIVSVAVIAVAATMLTSSALAGSGWAGSRYAKSDCRQTQEQGRPGLFCQTWFSSTAQTTQTTLVADETCVNGLRAIERSGFLETRFRGFDFYAGPAPLAKFNTGGNEDDFVETWLSFTDTDHGCI